MANVFGGGGVNGAQRVLPTSSEVTQSTQTFSTQSNIYSIPQASIESINPNDFYTKAEINRILKTKIDTNSVYNKEIVDSLLGTLEARVNSSMTGFVDTSDLSQELSVVSQEIIGNVQENYYDKSLLYTQTEINSIVSEVTVDVDNILSKTPTSLLQNTVNPMANEAIPLTLIASSSPNIDIVQQWIDADSNSIGRIRTSGKVELYGHLILGENIESWRPALDVNLRRIAGVADPIHPFDAVNKDYMEDYITDVIDNVIQGDDKNYVIDALIY